MIFKFLDACSSLTTSSSCKSSSACMNWCNEPRGSSYCWGEFNIERTHPFSGNDIVHMKTNGSCLANPYMNSSIGVQGFIDASSNPNLVKNNVARTWIVYSQGKGLFLTFVSVNIETCCDYIKIEKPNGDYIRISGDSSATKLTVYNSTSLSASSFQKNFIFFFSDAFIRIQYYTDSSVTSPFKLWIYQGR